MINLMQGNCLELMKTIPDGSVDLILTDPPYGTTACKWDSVIPFEPMWEQLKRIIKPNGAIVLFGSQPFTSKLICSNIKMFKYEWVWEKSHGAFATAKIMPLKRHENVLVFAIEKCNYYPQMVSVENPRDRRKEGYIKNNARSSENSATNPKIKFQYAHDYNPKKQNPKSIIRYSNPSTGRLHPTQKPVALLEYLIKTYTQDGETVLDFTMGSGSTGVACVNTNRKFIGIELDEKYFQIAKERIANS